MQKHQASTYVFQFSKLRHLPSESIHQAAFYLHGFPALYQIHEDT